MNPQERPLQTDHAHSKIPRITTQSNSPRSEESPSQPQRDGRKANKVPHRGALLPAVAAKVPEDGLCGVRGAGRDVRICVDLAGDDCVDVCEADVVAIEAVCLVDDPEALVVGLDEGDVDALCVLPILATCSSIFVAHWRAGRERIMTYRKQRRAVHGKLNNLDGGVVAGRDGGVGRQRDLGQAHRARVGVLGWAEDLEGRDHGEAHVPGAIVGTVGAEAHVDVEEGCGVALEPARLEGDGAACRGPVCAVCCCWVAAACGGRWYVSLFVPEAFCAARPGGWLAGWG